MRALAAVAILLTFVTPARSQPAAPGFAVQKIWTTGSIANSAGTISVTPDPSKQLIVVDVTGTGASPLTVPVSQLSASAGPAVIGLFGAAPVSPGNFDAFIGFPPGWQTFTDAQHRQVRMGREKPDDPIQLVVAPGATVSLVYIVPKDGPSLTVTLPGAGAVPLVVK